MGSILTLDSQLTERGLEDAPKLSLFIVGPGGSLHSRKASELAQDPFPQELCPPLKARSWQGTRLPVWHMRDQGTQEGAEEPVPRRPTGAKESNKDRQGPVSQEGSLRFTGRDSICPISRKGIKACSLRDGKRRPLAACADSLKGSTPSTCPSALS